jgi:stress-induced morphogen
MPSLPEVQASIEAHIAGAEVTVEDFAGDGQHLSVRVVAEQFAGLSRIEQHRLVYAAVEDDLGSGAIHALAIKTTVPPLER